MLQETTGTFFVFFLHLQQERNVTKKTDKAFQVRLHRQFSNNVGVVEVYPDQEKKNALVVQCLRLCLRLCPDFQRVP